MENRLTQDQAPLFEELLRYIKEPLAPFHTPGHKGGRNWEKEWRRLGILADLDLTEISALNWDGALSQAEILAAQFHKADESFFLVQGASQGIIGGILGAFSPGDTVLVSRNCHVSVMNAIILADLNPVFLVNDFHPSLGIPLGIRMESLKYELKKHPDAKGLIITNPTYQGVATRVSFYRELIGERLLIVDEAHGGHFGWSGCEDFDAYQEADFWVQGAHKIFGTLTQTGMLHLRHKRIDPEKIKQGLKLITTTSPSYILLASLDSNRRWLAKSGNALFRQNKHLVCDLKKRISELDGPVGSRGITLLDDSYLDRALQMIDPWKLTISLGVAGLQAEKILQRRYRIQPEYADNEQLTFFIAPWQEEGDLKKLYGALLELNQEFPGSVKREHKIPDTIPPLIVKPREAVLKKRESAPLDRAIGRISASVIAPYPPGIPLIGPGELIREEETAYLFRLLKEGGKIEGINAHGEVFTLKN